MLPATGEQRLSLPSSRWWDVKNADAVFRSLVERATVNYTAAVRQVRLVLILFIVGRSIDARVSDVCNEGDGRLRAVGDDQRPPTDRSLAYVRSVRTRVSTDDKACALRVRRSALTRRWIADQFPVALAAPARNGGAPDAMSEILPRGTEPMYGAGGSWRN